MAEADYADLHRRLWRLVLTNDRAFERGARALVGRLLEELRAEGYPGALSPALEQALTGYLDGAQSDLRAGIEAATRLGSPAAMRDELVAQLAKRAFTERWPDEKTLTDRVWGWKRGFKDGFHRVLAEGSRRGASINSLVYDLQREIESHHGATFQIAHNLTEDWATELADRGRQGIHTPTGRRKWNEMVATIREDYLPGLAESGTRHAAQTAFQKIVKAVEAGNLAAIDEAVAWWMYDKQLHLLKRIARTEMATAQHRAVIASAIDDPDIIGFQWRLSSSHPEPDICDYYANIDMGLGRGVWTKEAVPRHKAHPHCMCLLIPRVTPVRAAGSKSYGEFIQNVTPERRNQLLPTWAKEAMAAGTPLDQLIRPDGLGLISKKVAVTAGKSRSSYETAKSGGRRGGYYQRWKDRPASEIEKSIRSLRDQIEVHRDKISHPERYITKPLSERERKGLIEEYWPKEVLNFESEINILEGILRDRP